MQPRTRESASLPSPAQRLGSIVSKVAPEVGFEPTTNRLTADRSTTELLRIVVGQNSSREAGGFKRKERFWIGGFGPTIRQWRINSRPFYD
jgi:hypothetical protein